MNRSLDMSPFKITAIDLFNLNELAHHKHRFNRSIEPAFLASGFNWICDEEGEDVSEDTILLLVPVLVHRHKAGKECDVHIRCTVASSAGSELGMPLLDVDLRDFWKVQKNGKKENADMRSVIPACDKSDLKFSQLVDGI